MCPLTRPPKGSATVASARPLALSALATKPEDFIFSTKAGRYSMEGSVNSAKIRRSVTTIGEIHIR
jgi:hypothetical protein